MNGGIAAVTAGLIGGLTGGITAARHGGNFWSGKGATFATYADGALITGEPLDYNTETAKNFADKHFKSLDYYDKVSLKADGTVQVPRYKMDGDWLIGKNGQKAFAVTEFQGVGKGSQITFAKSSFASARQLYLIMGHEYIHAGYFHLAGSIANFASVDKQHAAIYRWEQEVSRKWGGWNVPTGTFKYKSLYGRSYNYEKFFKINIPWID